MTRVVLTGATSLAGAEVLRALLARKEVESLCLLLPPRSRAVDRLESYLGTFPPRVFVINSGIRAEAFDVVIDCAPLAVETSIELLERNHSLRLVYLSTSFVGGTRRGLFTEFDLDIGQRFHDAWERGHFDAEVRLRASRVSGRVTIVRPSHTLGRAATGEAFELGGAYPLLSALASASLLPGDARARIDFVPADYVAAATVALALSGAAGTFHLASGWGASIPVRHAAALAAQARGRRRGALLLPRIIAWPRHTPYLYQGPVFDTFLAERVLGIQAPPVESWLAGMLDKRSNSAHNRSHYGTDKNPASPAFRI